MTTTLPYQKWESQAADQCLEISTSAQDQDWDDFLLQTTEGNHLQSCKWGQVKTGLGWVEVDLGNFAANWEEMKRLVGPHVQIMQVVKADAYGHGAVRVSKVLEQCGVRALGVATVEEGVELRRAGIEAQILVMGGLMGAGSAASIRRSRPTCSGR